MRSISNKDQILIGADASLSTGNTLNNGEIGIFNAVTGARVNDGNSAAAEKIMFAQGRTYNGAYAPLVSDVIELSKITHSDVTTYTADQEQITTVGYDGSAGSIDLIDNFNYYLRIYIEELVVAHSDGRDYVQGNAASGTTALGSAIANDLAKTLQNSLAKRAEKLMKVEILTNRAGVAFTSAVTATFTKGSKAVVATAGAFGAAEAVAGAFVRAGTATTAPVYKIATRESGTLITLDRPFEGATTSVTAEHILNGTGSGETDEAGAAWGLKITGEPLGFALETVGKKRYMKSRFTITTDSGNTPVVNVQPPLLGTGTVEQVAEFEWFAQGDDGEQYRMGEPFLHGTRQHTDANVPGGGYRLLTLQFIEDSVPGFVPNVSKKLLTVAVPQTVTGADYVDTVDDGLNALLADFSLPAFS